MRSLKSELLCSNLKLKDQVLIKDEGIFINATLNYVLNSPEMEDIRNRKVKRVTKQLYCLMPKGEENGR